MRNHFFFLFIFSLLLATPVVGEEPSSSPTPLEYEPDREAISSVPELVPTPSPSAADMNFAEDVVHAQILASEEYRDSVMASTSDRPSYWQLLRCTAEHQACQAACARHVIPPPGNREAALNCITECAQEFARCINE